MKLNICYYCTIKIKALRHVSPYYLLLFAQLYARVGILLTSGKHLHDRIISQRGEFWSHKTSLTLPLFIEVPVPSQESERSCICVLGVSILPLSTILILELFRQCGILCFSFFLL